MRISLRLMRKSSFILKPANFNTQTFNFRCYIKNVIKFLSVSAGGKHDFTAKIVLIKALIQVCLQLLLLLNFFLK